MGDDQGERQGENPGQTPDRAALPKSNRVQQGKALGCIEQSVPMTEQVW